MRFLWQETLNYFELSNQQTIGKITRSLYTYSVYVQGTHCYYANIHLLNISESFT